MQSWDVLNLEADNQKLYYTTSKRCWNVCQLQYLTRLLRIAEHALLNICFISLSLFMHVVRLNFPLL